MKQTFSIPEGVNKITLEIDRGMAIITIGKMEPLEFESEITGELEQKPIVGNLCILWNDDDRENAIIAKLQDWENDGQAKAYKGANRWYHNAIRFRNGEQLDAILGNERD
ncbi:MAG: hypothetical protein LKI39_02550 [Bacteroides sp.]|jgi:hypothetical protein|nr:hypothetical protein [Bacteroides sp.]